MVITSYTPAHKISRILVLSGQNSTRITAIIWSILNARQHIEVKIQRSSNELCYMHIDAVRVQSDDGDVTLRATLTDITERKQSEQKLRIAATAFEVQEGILVTDEHKIIVQVNKSFTRITGYQESEVIGQHASILSSGQHDARFFQAMWEEIKSNQFWQGELWNKRKGGELFPAWMSITTVLGEDGYPSHYVGSFLDITLQKQAENVLLDARRHLEKQVERSVSELQRLKDEGSEVSTALKVMLKLRESESVDARNLLILELKQEVMPFLQKLRISSRDAKQVRLLSALDANLQRLISSYGCATSISSAYKNLTPKEIQVASMVREGTSTKVIASTLSLSPETISIHRKNIRKKLGLDSKSDNLRSYLITLDK
ncbi:nitrogen fixation regulatory protein [mine drainage metagenome]|uniref:Nitrogen fixation regulatory protein n=1 Tax=mine drainage metagenome TaxID=410659 RepID=A0A1J5RNQ0_9ZZZZ